METKKEEKLQDKRLYGEKLKRSEQEQAKKEDEKESLQKQLEDKNQKINELTDTLQRLQAEFENYKKRTEREKADFARYSNASLILKLLPVLDSFELALQNTADREKFVKGIEMIFAQLYSVLEEEGLRPIKAAGERFDPYRHEVLMKGEGEENIIIEEFQKGYVLNEKVLRHSKVKVGGK